MEGTQERASKHWREGIERAREGARVHGRERVRARESGEKARRRMGKDGEERSGREQWLRAVQMTERERRKAERK